MWEKEIVLFFIGLISGTAAAAGTFALLTSVGVVPRMAGKSSTAIHVRLYETILVIGGAAGTVVAIFEDLPIPMGSWLLLVSGVLAGCFVGCLSAALAEVLQVWPVLFRRMGLKAGLNAGMFCFALGKFVGALYFFTVLFPK